MRSKPIHVRLSYHMLKALDTAASENFENRSAFIRKSIALRLNDQHIVTHKPQTIDWKNLIEQDEEDV